MDIQCVGMVNQTRRSSALFLVSFFDASAGQDEAETHRFTFNLATEMKKDREPWS
jgi:hypothetical protein